MAPGAPEGHRIVEYPVPDRLADCIGGIDRDHGPDQMGMLHRERRGDDTAERVTDGHYRAHSELGEKRRQIGGEHPGGVTVGSDL